MSHTPKEHTDPILSGKQCPYCNGKSELVDSSVIYGKSYGMIYLCKPCNAYCGVHKGTTIALGRLANKKLRELKKQAHLYFDMTWDGKTGVMARTEAYGWLSALLGISKDETHIGMFTEKQCEDTIYFSKQLLNDMRRLDMDFGAEPKTPYYDNV